MTAKILVADDSITIQKIVAMAFENEDAIVEGIDNGRDALARLKTFKPDVVLADIDMPGLTGFELSREIKESSALNYIYVLLLTNDFEEFDENLYQASLADNHITKPFKSEDLVKKVMTFLGNGSPVMTDDEDEETEMVIELTAADRVDVDDDVFKDLGEKQLMDSLEEIVTEEEITPGLPHNLELTGLDDDDPEPKKFSADTEDEEMILDLPHNLESTGLDDDDSEPKEFSAYTEDAEPVEDPFFSDPEPRDDFLMEAVGTVDDPSENEMPDHEESLDELLLKVEELSRKSAEFSGNGTHEKLSPLEAIEEMLKEVSALKEGSLLGSSKDENNSRETTEPQLSNGPTKNETVMAEVDYVSEENAEMLATAFDEITNGSTCSFFSTGTETSENLEPFFQEADNTGLENLAEDLSDPFISPPEEDTLPDLKESTVPVSDEEPSSPKEEIMTTGVNGYEADTEKPGESFLPEENQLQRLMEQEVRNFLQQSLTPLIEKEISGLSEKILRAVEENVRQVTPGIAKTIIEKEIDKIKTMEDS